VTAVDRPVEELPAVAAVLGRCAFPPSGAPLTCAVSGGADSLALLVLATAAGCAVTAVHVDHGLRVGSADEAGVVRDAAARFGAAFRAERVAVPEGPNLEARARAARFAVLPPDVATGHTMDDQAETVLANLLRGAGADGMAGMAPGPAHPLLGIRRAEARAVCEGAGLAWVEDASNDDRRFLRNRIRHELLPLCEALTGRDPVPLLARHAAVMRTEAELLDRLAAEALPDPADARALRSAPGPLARRAVRRWLREAGVTPLTGGRAGGGPAGDGPAGDGRDGDHHPPTLAEVDRVLAVAAGSAVATEVAGHRVRRSSQRLVVDPAASGKVGAVMGTEEVAESTAPEWAGPLVGPTLVSAERIAERVAELGRQITLDYAGEPPLLVGVLKGAMLFMSDLCRSIELPVDVDFMAVSSYGSATRTSGVVRIVKDLDAELTGRRVLVVEDIIDSGLTLNYLRRYLQARHPVAVDVCALLVKEGEQRVDLDLRYVGFTIPSEFVVGYGLDVAERFRNLRGVHRYLGGD
jgi:hypoxanthine phosphoribosyltransferase